MAGNQWIEREYSTLTHKDQFGTWVEPSGDKPAGYFVYKRSHSPYERWMEEEDIPVVRGIGVHDTRDVSARRLEASQRAGCLPLPRRAGRRQRHVRAGGPVRR